MEETKVTNIETTTTETTTIETTTTTEIITTPATAKAVVPKAVHRDYLFDNLRAVFIILVVWGHLLTSMKGDSHIIRSIYFFIFFFHMPAMAFVSGYFSKNLEKIRANAFVTILVPYLILNLTNYAFKMLVLREHYSGFRFLDPYWGLWYLLALFIWKFFLKDLLKIRYILPISFAFALLSGFSKEFGEYLSLGRVIGFLPFFLLGYYCTKEHVAKIRRMPKLISIAIIMVTAAISTYFAISRVFRVEILFLRSPYPEDLQLKSMLCRLIVYIVAISMITATMNLMTSKKTFLSTIGTSTMTVYILHLFTIPILEKYSILKGHPNLYLVYSILMTVAIVFLYTRPVVIKGYDAIMDKLSELIIKTKKNK